MIIVKQIIYSIVIFVLFSSLTPPVKRKFKYGVCGHPLTQEAYANNTDLQIRLIKSMNSKFYRVDVPIDSLGHVAYADRFLSLIKKLQSNGIKVLPVLVFGAFIYSEKSPEESYKKGLLYGRNFSRLYKKYFDYYEVGNEEDNNLIIGPQVRGDDIANYKLDKAKIGIPYIKGVCEAIRKEDVSAKIIINHGWVHYGFLQLLKSNQVNYDIIGSHWYSDMGNIKDTKIGEDNLLTYLTKTYKKRIWVTEFNIRNGPTLTLNKANEDWFIQNMNFLHGNKNVDAVFVYELLDQPAFANARSPYYNVGESNYGLGAWQGKYTRVQQKPLFGRYKSFIQSNP